MRVRHQETDGEEEPVQRGADHRRAAWFTGKFRDESLNERGFAGLAEARAVIERRRLDYSRLRPHLADGGHTPEAAHLRAAGVRLRNPDQLRRAPATIAVPKPL